MPDISATWIFQWLKRNVNAPILVLEGSSRSSKTYSICQYLILRCVEEPGIVVRGYRHDGTTCNDSIIPDFKENMRAMGLWDTGVWNKQEKTFTFRNAATFSFAGTNDEGKLHGRKQDIAWLNEVMEIHEAAYDQISIRTTQQEIMDFNPSFSHHWVFTSVLGRDDVVYCHSTYKDNPFLEPKQIRAIEKYEPTKDNIHQGTADEWQWDVYGLGKRGKVKGAVFKLWGVIDRFPDPWLCRKWGYGLDFGFSADPAALIECALFQDALYLRQHIYETDLLVGRNMTRPDEPAIEGRLAELEIAKDAKIYADCAQPESIRTLQTTGYNVVPCVKGQDSVLHGIDTLRSVKLMVDRRSHDLQMELEHYKWKAKPDGTQVREPEDKFNHLIDAARYWAMSELDAGNRRQTRRKPAQAKTARDRWRR